MTSAAIFELTPEQELYRAEKEKRAGRVRPELVAAAAVLQRLDDEAREARKGGRPKGPDLVLGRNRRRAAEPDPEMPGRPEWLAPFTPPIDNSPMESPSASRVATECGHPCAPRGIIPKLCPSCKGSATPAPAPAKKKPRGEKPKKRKPVRTGFHSEPARSTRSASSSRFAGAIEEITEAIGALDAQREQLVEMRNKLQELEAA